MDIITLQQTTPQVVQQATSELIQGGAISIALVSIVALILIVGVLYQGIKAVASFSVTLTNAIERLDKIAREGFKSVEDTSGAAVEIKSELAANTEATQVARKASEESLKVAQENNTTVKTTAVKVDAIEKKVGEIATEVGKALNEISDLRKESATAGATLNSKVDGLEQKLTEALSTLRSISTDIAQARKVEVTVSNASEVVKEVPNGSSS